MSSVGEALIDLVTTARREVLLVAPFIKRPALNRIVDSVDPDVPLMCVTRWDPREIAAGVSDLDIWDVLTDRRSTTLRVRVGLHAKLYRADAHCLVGSANLTGAALGWSSSPNLELLVAMDASDPQIQQFEQELVASSVVADLDLYECMKRAVDGLRAAGPQLPSLEAVAEAVASNDSTGTELLSWLPSCRSPDRLFDAYQGRDDRMLTSAFADAQLDLTMLDVPPGLGRAAFNAYVAATLEQLPLVRDLDAFAAEPRSREEMSQRLAGITGVKALENPVGEAWDTVKLWLMTFFPERYRIKPPEGAEVFVRGRRLA